MRSANNPKQLTPADSRVKVLADLTTDYRPFFWRSAMTSKQAEIAQEAYARAVGGNTTSNWGQIIAGFVAKGIPASEITPRENVLTFWAWKAVGRSVRKGEHGVKVTTWIPIGETKREQARRQQAESQGETVKSRPHCRPRTATVFHISQTEPIV